ncbi:poly-gamma-glutamate system protein [Acidobacteriota bacterium]
MERIKRSSFFFFLLSFLFFILAKIVPQGEAKSIRQNMIKASEFMAEAMATLRRCQKEKGILVESERDVNRTGLIGLEFSSITTSVGSLEAKRTAANPNFAGLVVSLLKEAGVKQGDAIAVGASGSFPSLIIAALSVAKAMDLRPLVICSLGASQWGANNPDFNWIHMQDCLLNQGIFSFEPIAFSLGGSSDSGEEMSEEGRKRLIQDIQEDGFLFLLETDLIQNVAQKMSLYEKKAGDKEIKAFINIGGSWSNMGTDSSVLSIRPGLVTIKELPPFEKRGILHEMVSRKIPVIHLLYVGGLAQKYGLPWDPVPLPQPGQGGIYRNIGAKQPLFIFFAVIYLLLVLVVFLVIKVFRFSA